MTAQGLNRLEQEGRARPSLLFVFRVLLCVAVISVLSAAYTSLPQCAYCQLAAPFKTGVTGLSYLLECSNLRQSVQNVDNLVEETSEVSGWTLLRPADPSRPGQIVLKVKKDRQDCIFYPRMSGAEAFVEVWEDGQPKRLAAATGAAAWSPIGRQHVVELYCAENGARQDIDVNLRIVLNGRWAQLWMKDGRILF
ncbi:hypothetical protein NNJEOMEG_00541 [Fundidesulfovibrio magnetotacticus]|uniref:Uncharacterized protein n=1 Tax=Fundidesulfovibrio magnetotacticus TaxID=2730080 RepID=A0A6V8LLX9_9BACT|nr:hypothetical protein [Fundidesulfovibrio magnetotacticus]GFK92714.1 hypothetical protein NNJEOMEG_00541 [Fundidesulfovibrio magnetotacticus]